MKNLVPFTTITSFDFHKRVIESKYNSKKDPDFKTRLSILNNQIEILLIEFDHHFSNNTLEKLNSYNFDIKSKSDLLQLYKYNSSLMQLLKVRITTTTSNRIINTCQNCNISEVNSFDHYLPKTEFYEFVVTPKNLIPSCTICNGHKGSVWRATGKRLFINLYLDVLPELQYLFVTTSVSDKDIDIKFYLDNPNNIDSNLFERIEYHYEKLQLCKRFSDNSDSVVTSLINSVEVQRKKLSQKDVIESILEISLKNQVAFGHNYWKSILETALVNNQDFIRKYIP